MVKIKTKFERLINLTDNEKKVLEIYNKLISSDQDVEAILASTELKESDKKRIRKLYTIMHDSQSSFKEKFAASKEIEEILKKLL